MNNCEHELTRIYILFILILLNFNMKSKFRFRMLFFKCSLVKIKAVVKFNLLLLFIFKLEN